MEYIQNSEPIEESCIFCTRLFASDDVRNLIIMRGSRAFVILNRYPYTSGHLMIVPNDHQQSLGALDQETRAEIIELTNQAVEVLTDVYHPEAFNLGMNIGKAAGAGIDGHIHMHVVPRWTGDTSFMSTIANMRVLPEALEDTYIRVKEAWNMRR